MSYCESAIGHYRLVVGKRLRRRRRHVVMAVLVSATLGLSIRVGARRALRKGASSSWWSAMVAVIHTWGAGGGRVQRWR